MCPKKKIEKSNRFFSLYFAAILKMKRQGGEWRLFASLVTGGELCWGEGALIREDCCV